MRRPLSAVFFTLLLTSTAFAKDVYFPIAGSTSSLGAFKTDVRLFNPSASNDITISVSLLPVGNRDNSSAQAQSVTVAKRQMKVLNDVVSALGGSDLAAIKLSSSSDFIATERVYAAQSASGTCNISGTLGQDVPALDSSAAKKNGVLLHLKTTTGNCSSDNVASFRTNIGAVNPNSTPANVTFRLYDKSNVLLTGNTITIPPMGVIAPTNMVSGLFFNPGASDLTDAWVSYGSDQSVLVYASVIDNCTSDPTFVSMAEDATPAGAKTVFFPTASATSTKTDVRLFNPSPSTDITVQATVLPAGNHDNSAAAPHAVTVPHRQMVVLNDAIAGFGGSDMDALRLTSSNAFVATERMYAQRNPTGACNIGGTLGQDVAAFDSSAAQKAGILLQLKGGSAFTTNIGIVNPNTSTANVTFRLYDKNNTLISTGPAIAVAPLGVVAPTSMTSGFFFTAGAADLTDAWVSYTSDVAVIAHASVIDTGTNDPTFFAMAADTGSGTTQPTSKTFAVTVRGNGNNTSSYSISVTPSLTDAIAVGDSVTFTITSPDNLHGFELQSPEGAALINIAVLNAGQSVSRTITITKEGTYNYFCTNPSCGVGHSNLFGQFQVGEGTYEPPPRY